MAYLFIDFMRNEGKKCVCLYTQGHFSLTHTHTHAHKYTYTTHPASAVQECMELKEDP